MLPAYQLNLFSLLSLIPFVSPLIAVALVGKLKRSANKKELKGGYTTGACAAAATRAAVRCLVSGQRFSDIEITLPNRQMVTFELARLEGEHEIVAGVIKDAGDDPDCTHGIEIQCIARKVKQQGITLIGGKGVATVTLPGLELSVGEAAINPVPRKNILEMAALEWQFSENTQTDQFGLELEICVPRGEEVAKETISERLGLLGGISILGTRGTVKPYSTSAFAASVRQSVQIASANGRGQMVLTTGSRSEKAAMALLPELSEMSFIQAGDFMGVGLRAAKRYQAEQVTMVAMIGKMGKLVSGRMMTHVSGHAIDFAHLAQLAREEKIPETVCSQIAEANTGRHVLSLLSGIDSTLYLKRICKEAHQHAVRYTAEDLVINVILIDFDGSLLACHPQLSQQFNCLNNKVD